MTKAAKPVQLDRRKFVMGATAGVGAALTVATIGQSDRQARERSDATQPDSGYRLTDHVRNYYRTATV
ncbi:MAG TPA: formate dehydrogenase [Burkholderiales bacterium]|nr:formate dehydrogenase [Burkholderiales bacterium]